LISSCGNTIRPIGFWPNVSELIPAYSDWFFVKSSFIRDGHRECYIAESVRDVDGGFESGGFHITGISQQDFYHLGFSVKTPKLKGNSGGGNNDAIEEAVAQVCRGMNGMVMYLFKKNPFALGDKKGRVLLPVVFTTAKLFVSQAILSKADLETGNLNPAELHIEERPFLYYQYHLSPGIKHGIASSERHDRLSTALASEYIRTIPIVSACGIETFFKMFDPAGMAIRAI
jgi:hypothetical protein